MKIEFKTPKEVVVVKELKRTINELTIDHIIDNPGRNIATAVTSELGLLVLWEGEAYEKIGQWTDSDVLARVKELLK